MFTPSLSLRRGAALLLIAAFVALLAACSGSGDASDNTGGGTIGVVNGAAEINADDLEFDASTIQAPAGEEFTITLNNLESQPHNFAVYVEEGGEQIASSGDPITGPDATDEVTVPALEPGTYFFKCDVHPEMNGSIVVEGAASSGG
jgi:plastocyanin